MGVDRKDLVTMVMLLAGAFLAVLNQTLLSPALPVIMHQMDVADTTVQWLTSAYAMVEAIVIPMNAFLLGRFSARKLFAGGFACFSAGSLVAALAPTFPVLLAGRVLQAIATGIVMPMVFTIVLLMAPRERRGSVMGVVTLVISFAPAIGPVVAGVLIDAVGWRALFLIVTALGVIVAVLGAALLRYEGGFERTSFDAPSIVLMTLGMGSLLYGLSTCTTAEVVVVPLVLIVVGIVLLGLFARRQPTLQVPMLRIGTLRVRRFRTALLVVVLLEAALIAIDVLIPLYVQNTLGQTPTVTGLVMMPAAIGGAVTGVVAGRVFDKRGVRGIALAGAGVILVSALALCLCGPDTGVAFVAGAYFVEAVGWQMISTPTDTWGINSLNNEVIQHGNAMMSTLMQVGASFGTALIVSLTALGPAFAVGADAAAAMALGYRIAFIGTFVLLAAVAVVIAIGVRNKPGDEENMASAAKYRTGTQ